MKTGTVAVPSLLIVIALVIGCGSGGTPAAAAAQNSAPARSSLPAYEVKFTFHGYTGSLAGAIGCPVRPNGTATLTGVLSGDEAVSTTDDIEYTGTLIFNVDLDLCEADRMSNGEDKLCAIGVAASGRMDVELSVYADDRGAYVKASGAKSLWKPSIGGTCTSTLIAAEVKAFPDESPANVFNGEELKLPSGPLSKWVSAKPIQVGPNMSFEVLKKVR